MELNNVIQFLIKLIDYNNIINLMFIFIVRTCAAKWYVIYSKNFFCNKF